MRIHGLAGPGVSAPVIIGLTLDTPGATTGTFSGSGTLNAVQIAGMEAGNTDVEVHSQVFPGGEIRGQLYSAGAIQRRVDVCRAGRAGARQTTQEIIKFGFCLAPVPRQKVAPASFPSI